jgi:oligoendopeptidase F
VVDHDCSWEVLSVGFGEIAVDETMEMALRLSLDEWEDRLERADAACADVQWRRHFGQTNGNELRRLEDARSVMLLDDHAGATLRRWESRPHDPLLARRVNLALRRLRWAEIESQQQVYELRNRIDQAVINYRPRTDGVAISRVERSEILRRHPDRNHRRDAWLAMGPLVDRIGDGVRQLMCRRQALAREQGYDGFAAWALDSFGLNHPWIEGFFGELRRRTDGPYRAWLAEKAENLALQDGLRPWDLAFAAEQEISLPETAFSRCKALPAALEVADGLGLGKAAAGVRVVQADIPYAALCYPVRPPDDVRVLINPRDGRSHYDVVFHELGHALHWRCVRAVSPILRLEAPPFNESMACLWERFVSESDWLMGNNDITCQQVAGYRQGWAKRLIYRLRLRIAQATFEYRAYQAPEADLAALYRDVFSEHMGVPYDRIPGWAHDPFWTSHPVYWQNYVIGEAVASQTLAALRRQFGRLIGEPSVGVWLTQFYYGPGAALPWTEKVSVATGSPLGTADLLADLGCGEDAG